MLTSNYAMNEADKYLFDLQGYLVVENALDAVEVSTLNRLLDGQSLPSGEQMRFGSAAGAAPEGPGFLNWGQPFCDLLDHRRVMPLLRFWLGDCFRLDRLYGLRMAAGMPWGPMHADYGASRPTSQAQPGQFHPSRDNEIINGFAVVTWNLSATGPEFGGFCCIPGSHKSSYKLPREYFDAPERAPCVVIPAAPAGSVIIFSENRERDFTRGKASHFILLGVVATVLLVVLLVGLVKLATSVA